MQALNLFKLLFYIYPVIISVAVVLILFWLYFPRDAAAQIWEENVNSSSVVNNISVEARSTGGKSKVRAEIRTEADNKVLSHEVLEKELAGDAKLLVRQTIETLGDDTKTRIEISESTEVLEDVPYFFPPLTNSNSVSELPSMKSQIEIQETAREENYPKNAKPQAPLFIGEADSVESEKAIHIPIPSNSQTAPKSSWWHRLIQALGIWWGGLF